jgi:hypothetical protein
VTTERPVRLRKRASKRVLRFLAWGAGVASFLSPWVLLGLSPRPATAAPPPPTVVVQHHTVYRVVWKQAPSSAPTIRYVTTGGGGGVASTGGSHPKP